MPQAVIVGHRAGARRLDGGGHRHRPAINAHPPLRRSDDASTMTRTWRRRPLCGPNSNSTRLPSPGSSPFGQSRRSRQTDRPRGGTRTYANASTPTRRSTVPRYRRTGADVTRTAPGADDALPGRACSDAAKESDHGGTRCHADQFETPDRRRSNRPRTIGAVWPRARRAAPPAASCDRAGSARATGTCGQDELRAPSGTAVRRRRRTRPRSRGSGESPGATRTSRAGPAGSAATWPRRTRPPGARTPPSATAGPRSDPRRAGPRGSSRARGDAAACSR